MAINKLKNKIVAVVVGVVLLFGLLAAIWITVYTKKTLIEQKKQEITLETIGMSQQTKELLDGGQRFIEMVAHDNILIDGVLQEGNLQENKEVSNFLQGLKISGNYNDILVYDLDGTVLAATSERYLGHNFGYRSYFRQALENDSAIEVVINAVTEEPDFIFAHRIKGDGDQTIGMVLTILSVDIVRETLTANMKNMSDLEYTHMLVDDNGVVIASDKQEYAFRSVGKLEESLFQKVNIDKRYGGLTINTLNYEELLNAIKNRVGVATLEKYNNNESKKEIISISRVSTFPFYVAMVFTEDNFLLSLMKIYSSLGAVIIIGCVLAAVIIYLFLLKFLRPLGQLKNATEKISQGNFDYAVSIKSNDELEEVGMAFNVMAGAIKKNIAEIDSRVHVQTKDILKQQVDLENQKKAVLNILEDVEDETRKSKRLTKDLEKFKLAVEGVSDQIVITDMEGIILYMNNATEKITGYSIEESLGKKAGSKKLWGGNMEVEFYEKMWQLIKKEKKVFTGEVSNMRKNGEKYEAFASISPILGDDGAVRFFVGIERDITKIKQIDRAKTEFVSLASHQLRTPLTAIKWNAEIVLEEKMPEEIRSYIQQIYQSNERMIELVNGLLNVSRIDMGTFAVDPKSVDPLEIIDSVVSELESLIVSKNLIIAKKYEKKIGLLETDQKLLRIVLQNLLSNAVKYTNEKGEVLVSVKKVGEILKFSIKDSGIGIPKSQQERIFSKLFRAENAVASVSDGTGLGLYVTRAVIEQLGGKIGFKSQENKGTTFFFDLPVGGVEKKDGNKELTAM